MHNPYQKKAGSGPLFFMLFILFFGRSHAVTGDTLDSNYVAYYKQRLVITYFQSYRNYEISFKQRLMEDSSGVSQARYSTNAYNFSGFNLDFDKLSISFGKKTPFTDAEVRAKGLSNTFNLGASFTDNHFRIEGFVRRHQGMYDALSPMATADTNYFLYYQKPSMRSRTVKLKAFFFRNKNDRFSFMSSYGSTQRQLKTAGSLFLLSNLHYHDVHSITPFLNPEAAAFYGKWNGLNHILLSGLSFAPGYSFNLILFKKLFLNLTFAYGPELLYRRYEDEQSGMQQDQFRLSGSGEWRSSFGFNGKRFFFFVANQVDFLQFKNNILNIDSRFISGSANLGWRFKTREKGPLQKLRKNKWYKKL